jgi:hypothetical protein
MPRYASPVGLSTKNDELDKYLDRAPIIDLGLVSSSDEYARFASPERP